MRVCTLIHFSLQHTHDIHSLSLGPGLASQHPQQVGQEEVRRLHRERFMIAALRCRSSQVVAEEARGSWSLRFIWL